MNTAELRELVMLQQEFLKSACDKYTAALNEVTALKASLKEASDKQASAEADTGKYTMDAEKVAETVNALIGGGLISEKKRGANEQKLAEDPQYALELLQKFAAGSRRVVESVELPAEKKAGSAKQVFQSDQFLRKKYAR